MKLSGTVPGVYTARGASAHGRRELCRTRHRSDPRVCVAWCWSPEPAETSRRPDVTLRRPAPNAEQARNPRSGIRNKSEIRNSQSQTARVWGRKIVVFVCAANLRGSGSKKSVVATVAVAARQGPGLRRARSHHGAGESRRPARSIRADDRENALRPVRPREPAKNGPPCAQRCRGQDGL
jgi:hypothetical protein